MSVHSTASASAGSVSPSGVRSAVNSRYDLPCPVSRMVWTVTAAPDESALPFLSALTLSPVTGCQP